MPRVRSGISVILSLASAVQKLGQPLPLSYFDSDEKSSVPHPAHVYTPVSLLWSSFPVKAGSVAFFRSTLYCCGSSSFFHSSSVLFTTITSRMLGQYLNAPLLEPLWDDYSSGLCHEKIFVFDQSTLVSYRQ